jgi:hypothetical protein
MMAITYKMAAHRSGLLALVLSQMSVRNEMLGWWLLKQRITMELHIPLHPPS